MIPFFGRIIEAILPGQLSGMLATVAMESESSEAESGQNLFAGLCDEVMATIAQYSPPPDVYSLCLTSKHFFDQKSGVKLLSSRLLHASLTASLERVLRRGRAGLTTDHIESFSEMAASLPPGSVVISGSSIVQAALGEVWEDSDVDIYCTAAAAPTVRSWLVRDAGKMVVNAGKNYNRVAAEEKTDDLMTAIHHVEGYDTVPEGDTFVLQGGPALPSSATHEISFDYNEACANGESINESIIDYHRFRNGFRPCAFADDFLTAPYRIETVENVPLPYCQAVGREECKAIDLVVCVAEHSSAKPALEAFDINICKCSWNGSSFVIPDPHATFKGHSAMTSSNRKDFLVAYSNHFDSDAHEQSTSIEVVEQALELVAFEGVELPAPLPPNDDAGYFKRVVAVHKYAVATFERIKKYSARGVTFDGNLVAIAEEFQAAW